MTASLRQQTERAPRRYGEGTIYRRGRRWYIRWYVDGKAYSEATHSEKRSDAVKLLQQRLGAVAEGRPTGREGAKLTLTDVKAMLKEDYTAKERKSWDRAERAFDAVAAVFGERTKVSRVTSDRLHQYLAARLAERASRSTVQKELAAVKRALTVAVERGLLSFRVPFPKLGEIKNARCEFVEEWEWALARPELPDYWQDMGDMALALAWRVKGEVRPLTWQRVDWEAGFLYLAKYQTKNGEARGFPFSEAPTVKAALERRRAYTDGVEQRTGKPVPWVFHVEGEPISDHRFYRDWNAACKKAGVLGADGRPKHPHDFRRSGVRAYDLSGVPRTITKQLAGIKTDAIWERYAIHPVRDLKDAVRRMHAPAPSPEPPHPEPAGRAG